MSTSPSIISPQQNETTSTVVFSSPPSLPAGGSTQSLTITGLPGATQGAILAGGTLSGIPQSGTFSAGSWIVDSSGTTWVWTGTQWTNGQLLNQRALTPLAAGLGNRQNASCSIACLGDSITEGQHSTVMDNRWAGRLRAELNARFPIPSQPAGGRGFIGCSGTGETSFTWPVTKNGSPGTVNQGPKGGTYTAGQTTAGYQLNASGQSFVFTLNGDSATIMWVQVAFGGTFSYQVDSGSTSNVSTNGSGTVDGKTTHISLGSAGSHTLTLAWVSGNASVDGVIEYYGDYASAIQTHDCGHFGWQTSNWVTSLSSGSAGGPASAIAALAPNAIIIALGVNDQFSNVAPATYGSNLQTIISYLKTQLTSPYPAFILLMYPPRSGQSNYTYPWSQYVAQAWAVALADTSGPGGTSVVSVLDFTRGPLMPGADTDVYGFWQSNDNVHPSNLGHQAIADLIAAFALAA